MADSISDMHMHSTASDGTDTPEDLLMKALVCGIKMIGITDHDCTTGCDNLSKKYEGCRIEDAPHRAYKIPAGIGEVIFVPGVEISTRSDIARHHILALGYDLDHPAMIELIEENLSNRRKSFMFKMKVAEERGIKFDDADKERLLAIPNAGRPHLAQMIVEKGLAKDVPDAFSKYLSNMPPNSEKMYVSPEYAVSHIHQANGIAIWAHPIGGTGEKRLSADEFEKACEIMVLAGIDGCECFYSLYNESEIFRLCKVADKFGWLRSGGSDYHGANKVVALGILHSANVSIKITSEELSIIKSLLGRNFADLL